MAPLNLTFRTVKDTLYRVIFKAGDDMRQDQLIIALIRLMDNLLKRENVDLKLTPYRVLATSYDEGLVECINSMTIAAVLSKYDGDILGHSKHVHSGQYNQQALIDTFVKSCGTMH
jgi:phosphatidylinositol 3-kinase